MRQHTRFGALVIGACFWATTGSGLVGAAPVGGQMATGARVRIVSVRYNPPGKDDRSRESLNGERVFIRNNGDEGVRIRGWKIHDRDRENVYTIKYRLWLKPGDEVYLLTGRGPDLSGDCVDSDCPTTHTFHWDKTRHVWENGGDTVTLKRADGSVVDRCRYTDEDRSPKNCV